MSDVSVVQNFTNELDGIGVDEVYKNIKELLGKYNVLLKELFQDSVKKDRFTEKKQCTSQR